MPSDTAARLALSPSLLGGATAGLAQTHLLRAFHPVDEGSGLAFFTEHLVAPLCAAFPHGEERTDIAMSGTFGGATWLARSGHIAGRFEAPLFGIPATGQAATTGHGSASAITSARPGGPASMPFTPEATGWGWRQRASR